MNRNEGDRTILVDWFDLEKKIDDFVSTTGGTVAYTIRFEYGNPSEPRRPQRVRVTANFFSAAGALTDAILTEAINETKPLFNVPRPGK